MKGLMLSQKASRRFENEQNSYQFSTAHFQDIPDAMSPYTDRNNDQKIFQSTQEMKNSGLINFKTLVQDGQYSPLSWEYVRSRYGDKKGLLIICGYFSDGATVGHTVAVRFDLGPSGIIMDGCHHDKSGGGIAYHFTLDIAYLLLSYPLKVFAYFPCEYTYPE